MKGAAGCKLTPTQEKLLYDRITKVKDKLSNLRYADVSDPAAVKAARRVIQRHEDEIKKIRERQYVEHNKMLAAAREQVAFAVSAEGALAAVKRLEAQAGI